MLASDPGERSPGNKTPRLTVYLMPEPADEYQQAALAAGWKVNA